MVGRLKGDANMTKKKKTNFTVINYDKNGKVIEDLSKLVVPREWQIDLLKKINRNNGF